MSEKIKQATCRLVVSKERLRLRDPDERDGSHEGIAVRNLPQALEGCFMSDGYYILTAYARAVPDTSWFRVVHSREGDTYPAYYDNGTFPLCDQFLRVLLVKGFSRNTPQPPQC